MREKKSLKGGGGISQGEKERLALGRFEEIR